MSLAGPTWAATVEVSARGLSEAGTVFSLLASFCESSKARERNRDDDEDDHYDKDDVQRCRRVDGGTALTRSHRQRKTSRGCSEDYAGGCPRAGAALGIRTWPGRACCLSQAGDERF